MSSAATTYEFLGKLSDAHKSGRDLNVRGYDAGKINQMNYKWIPGNRSADAEISADNPLMRARARDLARNDAMGVAASTGPVVGVGVGIEVGDSAGAAVGSSLTTGSAVAAGVDVRTGLGAAVSSSPPPQLEATSAPTIPIKSKHEPDRM